MRKTTITASLVIRSVFDDAPIITITRSLTRGE